MMFGSTILEVAIGLLFVYLLLSLLCSAVGEYIEAKFNNRAKYLKEGITLLLNDTAGGGIDLASQLYAHGLVRRSIETAPNCLRISRPAHSRWPCGTWRRRRRPVTLGVAVAPASLPTSRRFGQPLRRICRTRS